MGKALLIAMPFKAAETPAESSRTERSLFKDGLEAISKTILSFLSTPFDVDERARDLAAYSEEARARLAPIVHPITRALLLLLRERFGAGLTPRGGQTTASQSDEGGVATLEENDIALLREQLDEELKMLQSGEIFYQSRPRDERSAAEQLWDEDFEDEEGNRLPKVEATVALRNAVESVRLGTSASSQDEKMKEKRQLLAAELIFLYLEQAVFNDKNQLSTYPVQAAASPMDLAHFAQATVGYSGTRLNKETWALCWQEPVRRDTTSNGLLVTYENEYDTADDLRNILNNGRTTVIVDKAAPGAVAWKLPDLVLERVFGALEGVDEDDDHAAKYKKAVLGKLPYYERDAVTGKKQKKFASVAENTPGLGKVAPVRAADFSAVIDTGAYFGALGMNVLEVACRLLYVWHKYNEKKTWIAFYVDVKPGESAVFLYEFQKLFPPAVLQLNQNSLSKGGGAEQQQSDFLARQCDAKKLPPPVPVIGSRHVKIAEAAGFASVEDLKVALVNYFDQPHTVGSDLPHADGSRALRLGVTNAQQTAQGDARMRGLMKLPQTQYLTIFLDAESARQIYKFRDDHYRACVEEREATSSENTDKDGRACAALKRHFFSSIELELDKESKGDPNSFGFVNFMLNKWRDAVDYQARHSTWFAARSLLVRDVTAYAWFDEEEAERKDFPAAIGMQLKSLGRIFLKKVSRILRDRGSSFSAPAGTKKQEFLSSKGLPFASLHVAVALYEQSRRFVVTLEKGLWEEHGRPTTFADALKVVRSAASSFVQNMKWNFAAYIPESLLRALDRAVMMYVEHAERHAEKRLPAKLPVPVTPPGEATGQGSDIPGTTEGAETSAEAGDGHVERRDQAQSDPRVWRSPVQELRGRARHVA
ncbi:unnamed protein product [Amoebophrya sp. A120]|nr:unnamed protein product [Amoebophrya sp. A120]|eukprot:GSA120T00006265001.1